MRLINTTTLKIEEFTELNTPLYAILSHTWGDDEVNFQDMGGIQSRQLTSKSAKFKSRGLKKIVKCCEQAQFHGLGILTLSISTT
jgi:hypothetical protein